MANALQLIRDDVKIADYTKNAVDAIVNGEVNPLTAYLNLAKHVKVCDSIIKDERVKSLAIAELEKYGKDQRTFGDCSADVVEAGTKYDFEACGDIIWAELNAKATDIAEELKARETFLKSLSKPLTEVDPDTGETWTIYPPVKTSKTTIKTTFKK